MPKPILVEIPPDWTDKVPKTCLSPTKPAKRSQIIVMQHVLFAAAIQKGAKPADRAACARAYEVLEERLRILSGNLKPGSINARDDSQVKPKKKRKSSEISALPSPPQEPPEAKAG